MSIESSSGSRENPSQSPPMPDHASRSRSLGFAPNPSTSPAQTPSMRLVFDCPDDGTELVRSVSGPSAPSTVEVRFEPQDSHDQLIGEPAAWCNRPSAGQPLIFDVPAPASPSAPDTIGTLKVRKSGGSSTLNIPIKIRHNI